MTTTDTNSIIQEADQKMQKATEALKRELNTIRTGRASTSLVERIMVDYYNVPTPIPQVASVSVPEPRMILIQPWERNMLGPIEKAIQKSDLGVNPSNDGKAVRVVLPQLTSDRRKDLVKVVHKKVEEGRVAVRNVRRDAHNSLNKLEKDKSISADELKRATDKLQKTTDAHIVEVEKIGSAKEQEISEV